MNCVSCDIVYACTTFKFGLFVFFTWGIPQLESDWSLSCDHGLDYVMWEQQQQQQHNAVNIKLYKLIVCCSINSQGKRIRRAWLRPGSRLGPAESAAVSPKDKYFWFGSYHNRDCVGWGWCRSSTKKTLRNNNTKRNWTAHKCNMWPWSDVLHVGVRAGE